jgi:hypothetical protein
MKAALVRSTDQVPAEGTPLQPVDEMVKIIWERFEFTLSTCPL